MSAEHPKINYVKVWIILSVLFGLSLVATVVSMSKAAIVFVFVTATIKAWLVVSRFMHLSFEITTIKVLVFGCVLALLVMYVGVLPDIVWAETAIEAKP